MIIKFKKFHPEAKMPTRGSPGAAGWDLYASSDYVLQGRDSLVMFETGMGVEIPEGYVGLIYPRSSIFKKDLALSNSVGVIDSDYRGEIKFFFRRQPTSNEHTEFYRSGDRIGQLVVMKYEELEFEEVDDLNPSDRGTKGFGSTGA